MLIVPKEKIDDFIEELVDSILENVEPESDTIHLRGEMFESIQESLIIPEQDLGYTIREVVDRWVENKGS